MKKIIALVLTALLALSLVACGSETKTDDADKTEDKTSTELTGTVSTDNFYWVSRMIAAMTDASYNKSLIHIERYAEAVVSAARALVNEYDAKLATAASDQRPALREEANDAIAAMLKEKAADTLDKVLFELSCQMKNAYSRSDA